MSKKLSHCVKMLELKTLMLRVKKSHFEKNGRQIKK